MSVKKFRFVSPGVYISEIDKSQIPAVGQGIGPVVIGRSERGPSMRPITVSSFSEFVETFGYPIPGNESGDVWRNGNRTAPTYGAYAAQAWLRNASPLTYVRLLGHHHSDASAAGHAGWETGAAWGLFVGKKNGLAANKHLLTLASVIYTKADGTTVGLSGKRADDDSPVTNAADTFVLCQGTDAEVKVNIGSEVYSVNFNPDSKKFIRNVLNTNPTLINEDITSPTSTSLKAYFLGETYTTSVSETLSNLNTGLPDSNNGIAILMKLSEKQNNRIEAQSPQTGWVLSQHLGAYETHTVNNSTGQYEVGVERLFRFESLNDGHWPLHNLKIEISDIKPAEGIYSKYGSFSVTIRDAKDSDQNRQAIERYTGLNLNPSSPDYLARRIGDMDSIWSYQEGRYKTVGQYPNNSTYIRVIMNEEFEAGSMDPGLVPFGFEGPPSPRNFKILRWNNGGQELYLSAGEGADTFADSISTRPVVIGDNGDVNNVEGLSDGQEAHFVMPSQSCRSSTEEVRNSSRSVSFGAIANFRGSNRFDESYSELLRPWSADDQNNWDGRAEEGRYITKSSLRTPRGCYDKSKDIALFNVNETSDAAECRVAAGDVDGYGVVPNFTLDDLAWVTLNAVNNQKSNKHAEWLPGSRYAGNSISSMYQLQLPETDGGSVTLTDKQNTFRDVLAAGFNAFTVPFVHGFDGFDITEREPFRNTLLDEAEDGEDANELNSYSFNTLKRAIQTVSDSEVVEFNIATMPGVTNIGLTEQLLTVCEERGDALAILDLPHDYIPSTENYQKEVDRLPDIRLAIANMKDRNINSSYGCAYYPWVQIRDNSSDSLVWVPPSVVALGTMASSQNKTELWFAPAGFNRGGLSEGSAGLPVTQVRYKLSSRERDDLYENNINPIASFPSEGIVIFGQKTLQVTPSALDRINVRRLMIYLKKEISRIATTILFDQNVSVTWQRFTSQVNPFLASVRARFGISEFRVVLDETTTTPDLIDRNIVYAKIFLKPTRAIEFIALDFVIARSGASFDD